MLWLSPCYLTACYEDHMTTFVKSLGFDSFLDRLKDVLGKLGSGEEKLDMTRISNLIHRKVLDSLSAVSCRKCSKHSDTWNNCCNCPKSWAVWFYQSVTCQKDADEIANSVDPDQRSSLIWVYTVCPDLSVQILRIITFLGQTVRNNEDWDQLLNLHCQIRCFLNNSFDWSWRHLSKARYSWCFLFLTHLQYFGFGDCELNFLSLIMCNLPQKMRVTHVLVSDQLW